MEKPRPRVVWSVKLSFHVWVQGGNYWVDKSIAKDFDNKMEAERFYEELKMEYDI